MRVWASITPDGVYKFSRREPPEADTRWVGNPVEMPPGLVLAYERALRKHQRATQLVDDELEQQGWAVNMNDDDE